MMNGNIGQCRSDKVRLAATQAMAAYLSQRILRARDSSERATAERVFVRDFNPKASRTVVLGEKEMIRSVEDYTIYFSAETVIVEHKTMNITIGNIGDGNTLAIGSDNTATTGELSAELSQILADMIRSGAPEDRKAELLEALKGIKDSPKSEVKATAMELLKGFFKGIGGEGAAILARFLEPYTG